MIDVKIPIVVSAYNRPETLDRMLSSLLRARYPSSDISLYISMDNGGPNGVKALADAFEWPHGQKHVIPREQHLGMRDHAFSCMDLFETSDYLIFLEDDSTVGRDFYWYSQCVAMALAPLEDVFAASLYSFDYCEFDDLRFSPVQTEEDFYMLGSATTWGVIFSKPHWAEFREWYRVNSESGKGSSHVPLGVNSWPATSWKKYINRYLSMEKKFYLYPYQSHLTHFADPGVHFGDIWNNYQVPVVTNKISPSRVLSLEHNNTVKYDEFWEYMPPDDVTSRIGVDFECDIRRIKDTDQFRKEFVLTSREVSNAYRSFDASFFPFEMNVIEERLGCRLNLARKEHVLPGYKKISSEEIRRYMKNLGRRREAQLAVEGLLKSVLVRFGLR